MRYLFSMLISVVVLNVFAQDEYIFNQISTTDGLSNNTVLSIDQDKQGRIWFATYDGLSIYDGKSFEVIRYEPSDKKENLPKGQATKIVIDNHNYKWVLYENNQLVRILNDKGDCKIYTIQDGAQAISVDLFKGVNQGVVVQQDSLYFNYDKTDDSFKRIVPPSEEISFLNQNQSLIDSIETQFIKTHPNVKVHQVNVLPEQNKILIETLNSGLWIINDSVKGKPINFSKQLINKQQIASNEVYCSFIDREHNLWVGTKDYGVSLGRNMHTLADDIGFIRASENDENSSTVRSIIKDHSGTIWIGTYDKGVLAFKDDEVQQFSFSKTEGNDWDWIRNIYQDSNGLIWIGSYGGVCRLDKEGKHPKYYTLNHKRVYSIVEDEHKNIFFGAWGGIEYLDAKTQQIVDLDSILLLTGTHVRKLHFDKKGYLWVGTETSGVFKLDVHAQKVIQHYTEEGKNEFCLSSNSIFDICEDKRGNIWLGTFGGVNQINTNGKVDLLPEINEKLPTTLIYKMYWDSKDALWFSTSTCLVKYIPVFNNIRIYDARDGFKLNDYAEGAGFQDRFGNLYFGGKGGCIYFDPADIRTNKKLPEVYLSNCVINHNKEIAVNDNTSNVFSSFTKNIDLEINSVLINEQGKTAMSWCLFPYEKEFKSTNKSNIHVQYNQLPPGNYSFVVKARNADHQWTTEKEVLSFEVSPPFWLNFYFYLVCIVVLALSIVVFVRLRFKHIKKKNSQLQELIDHRTAKINKQKIDLQKSNAELEEKSKKVAAQRDQILAQNEQLIEMYKKYEEANLLKQKFFTNVSHDIRTPLSLIYGPLAELIHDKSIDAEVSDKLERMMHNVNYITQLLDQILDKKKLEIGGIQRINTHGDLVEVCKGVVDSFKDQAAVNKQELRFKTSHTTYHCLFDHDKLQQIIYNLLANATKFTGDNGVIDCDLKIEESSFTIEISDNGIGISEDRLDSIFERYYQVNKSDEKKGSGIGLSMVKDFVKLLEGNITVDSKQGEGSKFSMTFSLSQPMIAAVDTIDNEEEEQVETDTINNDNRRSILIVEDHIELQLYLAELIGKKYHVVVAENGKQAIKILKKNKSFSVIISDWMMNEMDGIALCKYVKSKSGLHQIPFVLLTAMKQLENQKEGYAAGVDEYISKPFEPDLLFLKIENLIHRSEQIQKSVEVNAMIEPKDKNETSFDEKLVKKIGNIIDEEIGNSEFNQTVLANKLGVSQMQLYRKVKENMQSTPNELIRTTRIKKARMLLNKGNFTVNEVSFMVGFNDPKYFSRCFTKENGISPATYRKEVINNEVE
ncbi:hybrid sensor histidine kinase/response regulator transcription factor [Plebeiibacterium sediminum]|uniref:histidine kinase n=1 Tax=Plebeiibacterium sediminum TaxID=2992112 RepID=A0AAE3M322_9BACT|nr:hybrid sensor histidine kinase/response regulator transcription factor [Plebeiobacterium sediminum]MCW3786292.1 ATP-binding protein [Plebeiobacterium sediminum]